MTGRARALLAAVLTCASGCVTPYVDVMVDANTASVRVLDARQQVLAGGRPPVRVHLPANVDHELTVAADGYQPQVLRVTSVTNGEWIARFTAISLLCPIALFMLPVALSRGAHRTLDPLGTRVELRPGGSPTVGYSSAGRPNRSVTEPPRPRPAPTPAPRPTPPVRPPANPTRSSAFCGACGARAEGARFCGSCGRRTAATN